MSWEVQGRQYHQWFGHGTGASEGDQGAGEGARDLAAGDVAAMVVAGAAASMEGALRGDYQAYLGKLGLKGLSEAMPIWAAASGLDAARFRASVVGAAMPAGAAGSLQAAARLVAGARDVGDLQAASARLAEAVEGCGAGWRYRVTYAVNQARYGAARGLVPRGGPADEGRVFRVQMPVGGVAPAGSMADGLVVLGRALLGALGPWGLLAGLVVTAGVGAYLVWGRGGGGAGAGGGAGTTVRPNLRSSDGTFGSGAGDGRSSSRPDVSGREIGPELSITAEMRPPSDAHD